LKCFLNQKLIFMDTNEFKTTANRRNFLGTLAAGAAAGIASIAPSIPAFAADEPSISSPAFDDPEEIFKKISGKHRIVFDSPHPHEIFPFAWPRVFLLTNEATGSKSNDCGVMVVLRHSSIGYAMEDSVWKKYGLGKVLEANDPETKQPAERNPFWKPKPGAYKIPGVGEILIGVDQLQANGVLFCVCAAAINVYSAAIAQGAGLKHDDVKNDMMKGILPGIQPVPSGVWALGRAQEHGCGYIFAG
jgi:hypothetical protein